LCRHWADIKGRAPVCSDRSAGDEVGVTADTLAPLQLCLDDIKAVFEDQAANFAEGKGKGCEHNWPIPPPPLPSHTAQQLRVRTGEP
jgi:hypothetical protein